MTVWTAERERETALEQGPTSTSASAAPHRRRRPLPGRVLKEGLLVVVAIWTLGPIVLVLSAALKSEGQLYGAPLAVPHPFLFGNFPAAFTQAHMASFIMNSVAVTLPTVVISLVTAALAGFSFASYRFRGQGVIFASFLIGMVVPPISVAIPLFFTTKTLGMLDSLPAVILAETAQALPLAVLIMRSAFMDIPGEIAEAARVDGAGEARLLVRVVLPLAKPALSAVAVLTFLACWNDFLIPLVLLNSESKFTLPLGLNYLTGQYMENWPLIAAATLITAVPGIVIYLVFQRRFVRGIVQGALK